MYCEVLSFYNGTLLFSGSPQDCQEYIRFYNYSFVKYEGENDEYWYVE